MSVGVSDGRGEETVGVSVGTSVERPGEETRLEGGGPFEDWRESVVSETLDTKLLKRLSRDDVSCREVRVESGWSAVVAVSGNVAGTEVGVSAGEDAGAVVLENT